MASGFFPQLAVAATAGVVGGLWLLLRGMRSYGTATQIGDTSTSRIATLAAGEVQVSGTIEAAELTLISPLQSRPCVYYKATISRADEYSGLDPHDVEERAVGFRIRDETGTVRVFPSGARWDALTRYDDTTGVMGDEPPGLDLRKGPAVSTASLDRATAIAELTTMPTRPEFDALAILGGTQHVRGVGSGRRSHYHEERLEPGDPVTIHGRALPFSDLADPAEADVAEGSVTADDAEVAGDIAEARAAGLLADSAEEAWGNAAIPGFGIDRPTRTPDLDPAARGAGLAPRADAVDAERRFGIAPETLVLASTPDVPLLVVYGRPQLAASRQQDRFLVGLLGAVLAIGSALVLALVIAGGLGS